MRIFFFILLFSAGASICAVLPNAALANNHEIGTYSEEVRKSLLKAGYEYGRFESTELPSVVGYVIEGLLSILGVIFLALVVYGGFEWLTSTGDEKKVATALGIIQQGALGLVIVLGAYIITAYVTGALQKAAGVP